MEKFLTHIQAFIVAVISYFALFFTAAGIDYFCTVQADIGAIAAVIIGGLLFLLMFRLINRWSLFPNEVTRALTLTMIALVGAVPFIP